MSLKKRFNEQNSGCARALFLCCPLQNNIDVRWPNSALCREHSPQRLVFNIFQPLPSPFALCFFKTFHINLVGGIKDIKARIMNLVLLYKCSTNFSVTWGHRVAGYHGYYVITILHNVIRDLLCISVTCWNWCSFTKTWCYWVIIPPLGTVEGNR